MLDDVFFLLANRIPRGLATRFFGWFSQIEHPLIRVPSLWAWTRMADLNLWEAKKTRFTSLHDCFTRELRPGARPIDQRPSVLVSPCDAIVGASGTVDDATVLQAKGLPYSLSDLLLDARLVERHRNGRYVTLRLTSSMYHRFHAPADCTVDQVTYISGDTWNVDPITVKRIERLYCRNERVVIETHVPGCDASVTLVPVAAILVASIRLTFLADTLDLRYAGPNLIPCRASFQKGEEMGYFQHGSTIIVLATDDLELCESVVQGARIKMGEPLLRRR